MPRDWDLQGLLGFGKFIVLNADEVFNMIPNLHGHKDIGRSHASEIRFAAFSGNFIGMVDGGEGRDFPE